MSALCSPEAMTLLFYVALCGRTHPGPHSAPGSESIAGGGGGRGRRIMEQGAIGMTEGYSDIAGMAEEPERRKTGKAYAGNARPNPNTYKMLWETCLSYQP